MKVLVTGGSGYLGTHVRAFFSADDLSRRSGRNILEPADAAIAAAYDLVIHMAALLDKSPAQAEAVFGTNVEGTRNLLKNIKKDAVFVFISTKDVYGRFADGYKEVPETCPTEYAGQTALEWSKLIAERYVEYYSNTRGFRSCIFRLSTTYGRTTSGNTPNIVGSFAEAINLGEKIALPAGGKPIRDYLHVDDLARACSAFESSTIRHGKYNLGGGRDNAVSLQKLVEVMESVSGLQAIAEDDPEMPTPVPLNYVSDLKLVSQELDWSPQVDLETGLKTLFR